MNSRRTLCSPVITRLVRVIAVLFLLYTGVEITAPQYCSEAAGFLNIAEAAADSAGPHAVSATADDDQKQLPSEQSSPDEDCFCCCAHLVPGRAVVLIAVSDVTPSFTTQRTIDLPSPPLRSPYHPPRLA